MLLCTTVTCNTAQNHAGNLTEQFCAVLCIKAVHNDICTHMSTNAYML